MIINEAPKCTECKNQAKFEIRDVEGVRAYSCREHKPKRSGGRAPFEIGMPECSAVMCVRSMQRLRFREPSLGA